MNVMRFSVHAPFSVENNHELKLKQTHVCVNVKGRINRSGELIIDLWKMTSIGQPDLIRFGARLI